MEDIKNHINLIILAGVILFLTISTIAKRKNLNLETYKKNAGKWQSILAIELDHDRERKVTILVQGIKK